jgi:hypothetical protein
LTDDLRSLESPCRHAPSIFIPTLLAVARASVASLPQADQDWIFAKTAQALYPALADK